MRDYTIKWKAYEYRHTPKSQDWFWALGIIAISIAITSIILENFLFAVLVLISAFALSIYALKEPRHVEFEIRQRGVRLDEIFYPFDNLESFWIEGMDTMEISDDKLLLRSKKFLMPYIVMPLPEDIDRFELRDYLLDHLDEERMTEPLGQKVMEILGF